MNSYNYIIASQFNFRILLNSWIGTGGPIEWPPQSPDLNPCDFFLWGTSKDYVFNADPIEDVDALEERINISFQEISAEMLTAVRRNFVRRLRLCIECEGGQIEHLL